jgi:hypothetical protein
VPAGVGEDDEGQKDTKRQIDSAVRRAREEGADEDWGPGVPVSRARPESIVGNASPELLAFSRFLAGGGGGQ